jgi:nucleotide-sensitive chloride channel 1A
LCDHSPTLAIMPPTTIHSAPALDSFTALADHQSQTPTSFYGAKPVLHYHGVGVCVLIAQDHLSKLPIFATPEGVQTGVNVEPPTEIVPGPAPKVTESVDAFVTSEYVLAP